jgi:hypothetical protein
MMSRRVAKMAAVLMLGAIAITGCETVGETVKPIPRRPSGLPGGRRWAS